MKRLCFIFVMLIFCALLSACSKTKTEKLQNGYYTAEAADFDSYGWKEFITIYINDDRIVTVEYNAKNASGFIKSWDMDYMRKMNEADGTYPNKYTRAYAVALLNRQNPDKVDAISGATHSYDSFRKLAEAAVERAKDGNKSVAFVALS